MTSVIFYHGSPHPNIKRLRSGSYVSMFPHISYIFGMYFTPDHPKYFPKELGGHQKAFRTKYKYGRTWNDSDLKEGYRMTPMIKFKRGHKPDGLGSVYQVKTTYDNINFHQNYPYELTLKKGVTVKKISPTKLKTLMTHSKKLATAYDQHYWPLQDLF